MQCPQCGRQVSEGARFCPVCGSAIAGPSNVPQPQPQPQPRSQQQPAVQQPPVRQTVQGNAGPMIQEQRAPMPPQAPPTSFQPQPQAIVAMSSPAGKNLAIASLVCGIVGVLCSLIISYFINLFSIVGLLVGVAGIVCAVQAKKRGAVGGMRTAGLVCSIIAVVVAALSLLFILFLAAVLATITGGM